MNIVGPWTDEMYTMKQKTLTFKDIYDNRANLYVDSLDDLSERDVDLMKDIPALIASESKFGIFRSSLDKISREMGMVEIMQKVPHWSSQVSLFKPTTRVSIIVNKSKYKREYVVLLISTDRLAEILITRESVKTNLNGIEVFSSYADILVNNSASKIIEGSDDLTGPIRVLIIGNKILIEEINTERILQEDEVDEEINNNKQLQRLLETNNLLDMETFNVKQLSEVILEFSDSLPGEENSTKYEELKELSTLLNKYSDIVASSIQSIYL